MLCVGLKCLLLSLRSSSTMLVRAWPCIPRCLKTVDRRVPTACLLMLRLLVTRPPSWFLVISCSIWNRRGASAVRCVVSVWLLVLIGGRVGVVTLLLSMAVSVMLNLLGCVCPGTKLSVLQVSICVMTVGLLRVDIMIIVMFGHLVWTVVSLMRLRSFGTRRLSSMRLTLGLLVSCVCVVLRRLVLISLMLGIALVMMLVSVWCTNGRLLVTRTSGTV